MSTVLVLVGIVSLHYIGCMTRTFSVVTNVSQLHHLIIIHLVPHGPRAAFSSVTCGNSVAGKMVLSRLKLARTVKSSH